MMHSKHSTIRSQQRCINDYQIELAREYGDMIIQNSETTLYFISNRVYNKLKNNKSLSKILSSIIGLVVIMVNDLIVTTYHIKDFKSFLNKNRDYKIYYQI